MVVYSDGITEAANSEDEMLGEERLLDILRSNASAGAKALQQQILEQVDHFTEGMHQTEDMTLVLIGA